MLYNIIYFTFFTIKVCLKYVFGGQQDTSVVIYPENNKELFNCPSFFKKSIKLLTYHIKCNL